MKEFKFITRTLEDGSVILSSVKEVDVDETINTPSTLLNLFRLQQKLREEFKENDKGFAYVFPFAFSNYEKPTNGFNSGFAIDF